MFHTFEDKSSVTEKEILLAEMITRLLRRARQHCLSNKIKINCNCHSLVRAVHEHIKVKDLTIRDGYVLGLEKDDEGNFSTSKLNHSWLETGDDESGVIIDIYPNGIISQGVVILPKTSIYSPFFANLYIEHDISSISESPMVDLEKSRILRILKLSTP